VKAPTRFGRLFKFLPLFLSVAPFLCTGGCTTAGTKIDTQQTTPLDLNGHKIVAVDVTSQGPDFGATETGDLAASIVAKLNGFGTFNKVYTMSANDDDADLRLSVVVTFFVNVDMPTGGFGGNPGSIDASVMLTDIVSGKEIADAIFRSHTKAKAFPGFTHVPTPFDTIEVVSRQIADFVTKPNLSTTNGETHSGYADYHASLPLLTTNQARIWFYLPENVIGRAVIPVSLDGGYVGTAVKGGFFCVNVTPGRHEVAAVLPSKRANEIVNVANGSEAYVIAHSKPEQVSETKGTNEIATLHLDGD
jgi:hypothetical protein